MEVSQVLGVPLETSSSYLIGIFHEINHPAILEYPPKNHIRMVVELSVSPPQKVEKKVRKAMVIFFWCNLDESGSLYGELWPDLGGCYDVIFVSFNSTNKLT